ncbi:HNH/ENDO VII family nuclease [Sulfurimonas sp. CS5]|uniref:HNH/ENDO VII family nuclease n=1 Tax=Sulfurimonas sp. CS5 TaxID=3391145 RepID=UPI0039EBF270
MRSTDVVWNVILGEENTQAKEFLLKESKGQTFENSRGEKQGYFTTKNGDFYDPTRYANEAASVETDIYEVAQDKAKDTLSNPEQLKDRLEDKVKEELTLENITEKVNNFIDESKKKSLSDLAKDRLVGTATSIVDGTETAYNIANASKETLDKIYGEGTTETIAGASTVLAVGSVVGNGKSKSGSTGKATKNNKIFTKETIDAPSGRTYNFYGQDIDLDLEFKTPKGKFTTNREWMKKGNNPYILDNMKNPVSTQQHHSQQNANGPIFEVKTTTHQNSNNKQVLHPYDKDGTGKNPNNPVDHKEWKKDKNFINKERLKKLEGGSN